MIENLILDMNIFTLNVEFTKKKQKLIKSGVVHKTLLILSLYSKY